MKAWMKLTALAVACAFGLSVAGAAAAPSVDGEKIVVLAEKDGGKTNGGKDKPNDNKPDDNQKKPDEYVPEK